MAMDETQLTRQNGGQTSKLDDNEWDDNELCKIEAKQQWTGQDSGQPSKLGDNGWVNNELRRIEAKLASVAALDETMNWEGLRPN